MKNRIHIHFDTNTVDVFCPDTEDGESVTTIDLDALRIADAATSGVWYITRTSPTNPTKYAMTTTAGNRTMYLHRLLCPNLEPGLEVSHKDGDGLSNVRANLEAIHPSDHRRRDALRRHEMKSGRSKTGFRGVYEMPGGKRFRAFFGSQMLGTFKTAKEAGRAAHAYRESVRTERLAA